MDEPEHPVPRGHRVQSSERTLRILDVVLAHPGRTVKQLTRLLQASGEAIPEHTVRDHLRVLGERGWVHRHLGGHLVPGPKAHTGGINAVRLFQSLLRVLHQTKDPLDLIELATAIDAAPQAVRTALDIGMEFGAVVETDGTYRLNGDGLLVPRCSASDEDIATILKAFVAETGRDAALVYLSQTDGLVLSHLHQAPQRESLLDGLSADAAHATAGGQALLAWLDADQRDRYLARHQMRVFTTLTPRTLDELRPRLIREPGRLYVAEGQYCTTGACLGLLVHNGPTTDGRIALTTSVLRRDLEADQMFLTDHLYRAAARLIPILDGPLRPPAEGR
jgi:DNA-binding IclR family transcriptional regulator